MTGNLASAWKYLWRSGLKLDDRQDMKKAINYLEEERGRRKGLSMSHQHIDSVVPDTLRTRVLRVLQAESGTRQHYFASLWNAYLSQSNTKELTNAIKCLEILINDLDEQLQKEES
jgi:hypothetical protein